jgi:tripartite-type tricarboxylate transporter receptor subunit TctC
MPDVREHLTAMGLTVAYQPQAAFTNRVRGYTQSWDRIIKASGFVAK